MKQTLNGVPTPTANLAINKSRLKVYGKKSEVPTYYLNKGQEFQIELFNPTTNNVLAKISLNGKPIAQGGLVLRPGERAFLDRYIDIARKFKFDTYEVADTNEVKQAITNATCSGIGVTVEESQYKIFRFLDRDNNIPSDGGGFRDLYNLKRPTDVFLFDTNDSGFDEGELAMIAVHDTGNVLNPDAGHLATIR